jgi:hypothetical protein
MRIVLTITIVLNIRTNQSRLTNAHFESVSSNLVALFH